MGIHFSSTIRMRGTTEKQWYSDRTKEDGSSHSRALSCHMVLRIMKTYMISKCDGSDSWKKNNLRTAIQKRTTLLLKKFLTCILLRSRKYSGEIQLCACLHLPQAPAIGHCRGQDSILNRLSFPVIFTQHTGESMSEIFEGS